MTERRDAAEATAWSGTPPRVDHGWPAELDPLIGRDEDMARLIADLERFRLVSLTGPGGSGKTHLARATLAALRGSGREAWFVDLSDVDEGSLLATTIMATLRFEGSPGREPLDAVIDALAGREVVLGLDNLEQIQDVDEPVTSLLEGAPGLRILATSRVPLGIRGEVEVAVKTLDLPRTATPADLESSAAGSLFLARARAIGRLRSIDDATASDVRDLLVRLDGLPLAIELAAARTRAMSPGEIVARLDREGTDAIDSLNGSSRRSLRAILAWTVGLLAPAGLQVLEAVSVCAGFDLGLAHAIAPRSEIVDAVESLVALGLVVHAGTVDGVSRFRLLETIRSEIQKGLSDRQIETFRDRHAEAFIELAADWYEGAPGGLRPGVLERMDTDADNIRRALDHLGDVDPRKALVLWLHLEPFWHSRGRLAEGLDRFRRIERLAAEPSIELARAAASHLTFLTGAFGPSHLKPLIPGVMAMAERVGDQSALIDVLSTRMWIAANEGDSAVVAGIELELEAIDVSGLDTRGRINLLELRVDAAAAREGLDSDGCVSLMRDLRSEVLAAGWATFHAVSACNLAQALLGRGEFVEAERLAGEAADALSRIGQLARVGWALSYQSAALAELGRTADAMEAIKRSASIADSLRLGPNVGDVLRNAMPLALAIGEPLTAARFWGAAAQMVEAGNTEMSPLDQRLGEEWLARAADVTPRVAFELAIREGRARAPIELLRSLADLSVHGSRHPIRVRHGALTKREIEILTLVGQGKTDQEIATALYISSKTASVHVSNIKAKLGAGSRLAVALRARELGLSER